MSNLIEILSIIMIKVGLNNADGKETRVPSPSFYLYLNLRARLFHEIIKVYDIEIFVLLII